MEIKLFGKSLFQMSRESNSQPKAEYLYNTAIDRLEKQEHLIDFHKDTGSNRWGDDYIRLVESSGTVLGVGTATGLGLGDKKLANDSIEKSMEGKPKELTPKEVYTLKTLNDSSFELKTDPEYVDEQLATFKEKLGMIKSSEFDMNYGTVEIGSIVKRLENRKKYAEHKDFYEQFPYTTSAKIQDLVKNHSYLKLGEVAQFLADMPKEAVQAMKDYTTETKKLCDKKPVFYIIANKKDFEKSQSRRDPILLAQSPFGHVWQILGAWDEEMLMLDEL